MNINQISVFLENKKGRLNKVCECLKKANINMRALSLADTKDFGVLRVIVNDPDKCKAILKKNSFVVQETNVLAAEVTDKPGGFKKILDILDKNNINLEYTYAMVEKNKNNAIVILKIDDQKKAIKVLNKGGVVLMKTSELKKI